MIVTRNAILVSFILARHPDTSTLGAVLGFELSRVPPQGVSISVLDIDAAWIVSMMKTIGVDVLGVGDTEARVRLDDGALVEVGHRTKDVWLDVRRAGAVKRDRIADAIKHINRYRAGFGQRDLDPVAVGWSDDDVLAEALAHGWDG